MKMKFFFPLVVFILLIKLSANAQFDDRSLSNSPPSFKKDSYFSKPLELVDLPTASILRGGDLQASMRLYEQGGVLVKLAVGISRYFMLGVSYGGTNIIGYAPPQWNKMPGVQLAYRIIEEDLKLPALVIGFDSQGYGAWWSEKDNSSADTIEDSLLHSRYTIKSRGFYVVTSKAFDPSLMRVGLHGGLAFSLEGRKDYDIYTDKDPTLFLAMDAQISKDITAIFEYDFGINDEKLNSGKGVFNFGFRWAFAQNMYFEFDFKNLLGSDKVIHGNNLYPENVRMIRFAYTSRVY